MRVIDENEEVVRYELVRKFMEQLKIILDDDKWEFVLYNREKEGLQNCCKLSDLRWVLMIENNI